MSASLLKAVCALDLAISKPLFTLELPRWAEWTLSVPGSIFGMPLVMTIMSLVVALDSFPVLALATVEFCVFLICWTLVVPRGEIRRFFKTDATLPFAIGANLLAVQMLNPAAFGVSCFFVSAFSCAVAFVAPLKRATLRLRPNFAYSYKPRALAIGPTAIQSLKSAERTKADQHAALPSGDAAACATFVTTLMLRIMNTTSDTNALRAGWAISAVTLALCCAGRMYWRHHHFLDVCAGSILGGVSTYALYHFGLGFDCGWGFTVLTAVFGAALNEFTAS